MRLAGRTAIVTGAASGIGQAVAMLFIREGARVLAVDRDAAALAGFAPADAPAGASRCSALDVTDSRAVELAVAEFTRDGATADVLVTCAAISLGGAATETSDEAWAQVLAVNVTGTFVWVRAVLPHMARSGRGAIVTVASQLALAGGLGNAAYVTSKAAVIGLTRSVALDYAAHGIRANCVLPGAIETPMLERSLARQPDPEAARCRSRERHPMGRFGTAEEVARVALFLASDDASFTTGALVPVEGGWLAG